MLNCFICKKQKNLAEYTGPAIAERGGWILTHFPQIPEEKATKGRLLIETTRHIRDLSEMNVDESDALGGLIRDGTRALRDIAGAEHVYLFRINDKVEHLHFHLVPRYPSTPKAFWGWKISEWPGNAAVTLAQIQQLSLDLRKGISSWSSTQVQVQS